jgi:sigma-B regulation protein RsbU (phosphoserine phosphatase)
MLRKISVKTRVLLALLSVSIITAVMIGLIATGLGISTLKNEALNKLVAIRDLEARQVEDYFQSARDQVGNYAKSDEVAAAFESLTGRTGSRGMDSKPRKISLEVQSFSGSLGFRNIYLVDGESGRVVYSSDRQVPAGQYVNDPALAGTGLERVSKLSVSPGDNKIIHQTDFMPFRPAGDSVFCFIGGAVNTYNRQVAIVVFQVAAAQVDAVLTGNSGWGNVGLGRSGETILAGEDFRIRNEPRYHPSTYSAGMQADSSDAVRHALSGFTGSGLYEDYRGVRVFAAYRPLKVNDLKWVIVCKIDRSEALEAMGTLYRRFLGYMAILLVLVTVFSNLFAKRFSRPLDELARANEKLRVQSAAIDSAANGVIITDTRGIVKWVNPAFTRLTGYASGEIEGQSLNILNSGVQGPEFFRDMWARILGGELWQGELVNRRKDGTLYTEEMTITPVPDSEGKILNFVAIKHDITERKRLEQVVRSANERMEGELNVAREIQMSMLPLKFPAFPDCGDLDIYARLIPARQVGGDFYDFYFIDEENFCFVVGDVSGKGVPAALFMAVTKALIKAGSRQGNSTSGILTRINDEICRENENHMFITVFIAILNTTTGHLVYSNAGHNPSFLLRVGNGGLQRLSELHGVVVGVFEGVEYKETVLQLNRGDSVFAYTDGVTEATNRMNGMFTEERLRKFLQGAEFAGPRELVEQAVDAVIEFEDGAEQADDITVLAVRFMEQTPDSIVDYLFTSITNRLENIAVVIGKFESFAARHNLQQETIQKINIVFDELLTNTISYAYQDELVHEIEIKIRCSREKLIVTIMDDGTPYNPFDQTGPDTSLSLEVREIGGLGIHLVKLLVDDYHYEYKSQLKKNITSFKKSI